MNYSSFALYEMTYTADKPRKVIQPNGREMMLEKDMVFTGSIEEPLTDTNYNFIVSLLDVSSETPVVITVLGYKNDPSIEWDIVKIP